MGNIIEKKKSKEIYEGEYIIINGKKIKNDKGTLIIYDNNFKHYSKYVGYFENDKKNKFGKLFFLNGEYYSGEWKDDKMEGKGKYYDNVGNRYEGEFKNNKMNGKGILTTKNFNTYSGYFIDDSKEGNFIFTNKNGSYNQIYKKNKIKQESKLEELKIKENKLEEVKIKEPKQDDYKIIINKVETELKSESEIKSEFDPEQKKIKNDIEDENFYKKNKLSFNKKGELIFDRNEIYSQDHSPINDLGGNETLSIFNFLDKINEKNSLIIKKQINDWTEEELLEIISQFRLNYYNIFKENKINGKVFLKLKKQDLIDIGITAWGDIITLLNIIEKLKLISKRERLYKKKLRFNNNDMKHRENINIENSNENELSNQATYSKKDTNSYISLNSCNSSKDSSDIIKNIKFINSGIFNFSNFNIKKKELEFCELIGEGNFSKVYRGKYIGTEVAIKTFKTKDLEKKKKKIFDTFVKEAELLSTIRDNNIILYMGFYICKNKYYIVTEYMSNGNLFDQIHIKKNKFSVFQKLKIAMDIVKGMSYLHSKQILHCDLKSQNIFIDQDWVIKLGDWGLSKVKSVFKNKERRGTPKWMAPEILRGENYDELSDVYSFGVILWELFTEEIPLKEFSTPQIMGIVGYENYELEWPKSLDKNKDIKILIKKCLSLNRNERPSFIEIKESLEIILINIKKEIQIIKEISDFFY